MSFDAFEDHPDLTPRFGGQWRYVNGCGFAVMPDGEKTGGALFFENESGRKATITGEPKPDSDGICEWSYELDP